MTSSPPRRSLLPSPFPRDDPPDPPTSVPPESDDQHGFPREDGEDLDQGEVPYLEPGPDDDHQALLPPPNFAPFFALIEDAATGEQYYPSVHYIFADDDKEILTAASMREQGYNDTDSRSQSRGQGSSVGEESVSIVSPLPPRKPGVKDRYILLDMDTEGANVVEAQSMSTEWQVAETQVRPAPTWDGDGTENGGSGGLMLMVSGVEVPSFEHLGQNPANGVLENVRKEVGDDPFAVLDKLVEKVEQGADAAMKITGLDHGIPPSTLKSRRISLSHV
jgi:hypothetical protein